MKKRTHTLSLRLQMTLLILVCWLVPVVMMLGVMGWYFSARAGQRAEQNLQEQFEINLRMCGDRLDGAVEASRMASYDTVIRDAWENYQRDREYADLYRATKKFMDRQYSRDSRFLFSVFWFAEDPGHMTMTTLTGSSGAAYTQVSRFWPEDFSSVREMAKGLDTAAGFLERDGRVYLVRNVMDSDYQTIGVLVLALNQPYYFEELTTMEWASEVKVTLGEEAQLCLRSDCSDERARSVRAEYEGSGCQMTAEAAIDYHVLMAPYSAYKYQLITMAALLLPLLLFTMTFLRHKVTEPINQLVEGAGQLDQGRLGCRVDYQANSREFQYLIDSFNQTSQRLDHQFKRIYQEEVALRDAHIKALQAHINPHFLNNTLEIINWEARMNGDAKVSKMIEALSTVLDAALDRKKSPEVRLAEEMICVNAYLYIIDQRFGKRLTVSIDLPQELMEYRVPRLILQPVIENAVEHGMGPAGHGSVALRGYVQEELLILEIENGGGLSPEDEAHIARLLSPHYDSARETAGNIGIANVNLRLRLLYGERCGLSIFHGEGDQVIARLKIALSEEEIVSARSLQQ